MPMAAYSELASEEEEGIDDDSDGDSDDEPGAAGAAAAAAAGAAMSTEQAAAAAVKGRRIVRVSQSSPYRSALPAPSPFASEAPPTEVRRGGSGLPSRVFVFGGSTGDRASHSTATAISAEAAGGKAGGKAAAEAPK
jgi:UDP-N-acetylglucosamine:LPS N-acetylglucosamine transferase